jgi:hypothetical protein
MPVCRVTPKAAIQAHKVLMIRSPGRHTLWPTFDSARNIVTVFNRRGVVGVNYLGRLASTILAGGGGDDLTGGCVC